MFLAKSKEVMQYQVMEGRKDMQESDTAPGVQVPREPAIVINGVPNFPPDFASGSQRALREAPRSRVDHCFGEWLVERKVRKWFGDKYYAGTIVRYDSGNNWYTVVYEDGDEEDLEWHELEEILLPLDTTIPLNTLVMDKFRHHNVVPDYRTNVASNQMVVRAAYGQQSNNPPLPGWLQASASASAGENALVCLKPSGHQPKKRGRPRKDRSASGDILPKKRDRPLKDRSTSGDAQPKKRGRPPKEPGEKSIDRLKLETVRAEKLKRESMLLRGVLPGTRPF